MQQQTIHWKTSKVFGVEKSEFSKNDEIRSNECSNENKCKWNAWQRIEIA